MANPKHVLDKKLAVTLNLQEKLVTVIDEMAQAEGVSKGEMLERLITTNEDFSEEVIDEFLEKKAKCHDDA